MIEGHEDRQEIEISLKDAINKAVDSTDPTLFNDAKRAAEELIRRLGMGLNKELNPEIRTRIADVVASNIAISEKVDPETLKAKIGRIFE